jgi:signal transduction histidine kinase
MGKFFFKFKNYAIAIDNLRQALVLSENREAKTDISRIHYALYEIYRSLSRWIEAVEHLEEHYKTEKDIHGIESERKLKSVSVQYRYYNSEKERVIALRDNEIYRLKNVELAEANRKLIELNDQKNEFMGIAAHDLKNPLSGILIYSKKLKNNADILGYQKIKDMAGEMERSSEKMFRLIEKFLDVNKIESGKRLIKKTAVNTGSVVNKVICHNAQHALSKNIAINNSCNDSLNIFTDPDALEQILDNLLSNAVKFTPPGKKVYINTEETPVAVLFRISDEGPGLTSDDKKKLFSRFAKLSAKPTAGEISTGLGLSIVKKLTEILGGKIYCESGEGTGAAFIAEIPKGA